MAVMTWCLSCKSVVWAYDHVSRYDLRGFLNQARMPCPICQRETGNYDGVAWKNTHDLFRGDAEQKQAELEQYCEHWDEPWDVWGLMRAIAKERGLTWNVDGQAHWFRTPFNQMLKDEFERGKAVAEIGIKHRLIDAEEAGRQQAMDSVDEWHRPPGR